jgi:hypothetical protein
MTLLPSTIRIGLGFRFLRRSLSLCDFLLKPSNSRFVA